MDSAHHTGSPAGTRDRGYTPITILTAIHCKTIIMRTTLALHTALRAACAAAPLLIAACSVVPPGIDVPPPPMAAEPAEMATPPSPVSAAAPVAKPAPAVTKPVAPPVARVDPPAEKPAEKLELRMAEKLAPRPAAKPAATAPAKPAAPAPLALDTLEQRLKDTPAIGTFTKLTLKNQVDDLLDRFRDHHDGRAGSTLAQLRQSYEQLIQRVQGLLREGDPALATAIVNSREAIWSVLADPVKFAKL